MHTMRPPPPPVSTAPWAGLRPSRRELFRVGLFGSLALAVAGYVAGLPGAARAAGAATLRFFRPEDAPVARAIIGAFNARSLPADPAQRNEVLDRCLATADRYFSALSPAMQDDAHQAFDLMNLSLVRGLASGLWGRWERAAPEQVSAGLERLRTSRLTLLRQIFLLFEGVATVGWYGNPESWPVLNYPGPPNVPRPKGENPL